MLCGFIDGPIIRFLLSIIIDCGKIIDLSINRLIGSSSNSTASFHVASYSPRYWTETIDCQSDSFVLSTSTEVLFFVIAISRDRLKTTNTHPKLLYLSTF